MSRRGRKGRNEEGGLVLGKKEEVGRGGLPEGKKGRDKGGGLG